MPLHSAAWSVLGLIVQMQWGLHESHQFAEKLLFRLHQHLEYSDFIQGGAGKNQPRFNWENGQECDCMHLYLNTGGHCKSFDLFPSKNVLNGAGQLSCCPQGVTSTLPSSWHTSLECCEDKREKERSTYTALICKEGSIKTH